MRPLRHEGRELAERFASERLDRFTYDKAIHQSAAELREASLGWIELHLEKKLATRELLETT
jgi:hypothetical protein